MGFNSAFKGLNGDHVRPSVYLWPIVSHETLGRIFMKVARVCWK